MPSTLPDPLIYSRLKDYCVEAIEDLIATRQDVFGPDDVTVYRQMQEDLTNVAYPCITVTEVSLVTEMTGIWAGDTETLYWNFPFNLLIRDREAGSLHEVEPKYMGWHQVLMDRFRQRLDYDTTFNPPKPFVQIEVFPKPVLNPPERFLDVISGLLLKFWGVETRV